MERFRMEIESLSKNEELARVVTAVFMSRLNPTLEELDDVKTAVSEAVTNAVIHGYLHGIAGRWAGADGSGAGYGSGNPGCEKGYGTYVYNR